MFISYARADDERPPFDDAVQGWVTFFWHQLRFELTNAGVHQADLWLDRYEIEPAEDFTKKIEAALHDAKLLILFLSPNWAQRPWCLREVTHFAELRSDAAEKTVIVKKLDLPPGINLPPGLKEILESREGYKFFAKEPTGDITEFYWRGLQDQKAYYGVLLKDCTVDCRPANPKRSPAVASAGRLPPRVRRSTSRCPPTNCGMRGKGWRMT